MGILILYIDEMLGYWGDYYILFWSILSAYKRVGATVLMIELFDYNYILCPGQCISHDLFASLVAANGVDMLPIEQGPSVGWKNMCYLNSLTC